jgi:hypothetical protein
MPKGKHTQTKIQPNIPTKHSAPIAREVPHSAPKRKSSPSPETQTIMVDAAAALIGGRRELAQTMAMISLLNQLYVKQPSKKRSNTPPVSEFPNLVKTDKGDIALFEPPVITLPTAAIPAHESAQKETVAKDKKKERKEKKELDVTKIKTKVKASLIKKKVNITLKEKLPQTQATSSLKKDKKETIYINQNEIYHSGRVVADNVPKLQDLLKNGKSILIVGLGPTGLKAIKSAIQNDKLCQNLYNLNSAIPSGAKYHRLTPKKATVETTPEQSSPTVTPTTRDPKTVATKATAEKKTGKNQVTIPTQEEVKKPLYARVISSVSKKLKYAITLFRKYVQRPIANLFKSKSQKNSYPVYWSPEIKNTLIRQPKMNNSQLKASTLHSAREGLRKENRRLNQPRSR